MSYYRHFTHQPSSFVTSHTECPVDNSLFFRHFTHQTSSFHTPSFVTSHTEYAKTGGFTLLFQRLTSRLESCNSILTLYNSLTAQRAAKRNPPRGRILTWPIKVASRRHGQEKVCSAQHKSGGFSPDCHLFRRLQSAIQNHGIKSRFASSFDTRTMNNLMTLKRKRRRKSGKIATTSTTIFPPRFRF